MTEVKTIPYGVTTVEFKQKLNEMVDWLYSNLGPDYWVMSFLMDDKYLTFDFDHEEDAIAFKLRFGYDRG